MAEAGPKSPSSAEPYLKGHFKISKVQYDVTLSATTICWSKKEGESNKAENVPINEILYAESLVGGNGGVAGFDIAYVKHEKKNVTRHKIVHFYGNSEEGEKWTRALQEAINKVEGRPRKLLVLVNPASGSSKGRQIYQNKAKIFRMAHIETDVIVTEKTHHIEEILATYDLNSINGIVIVGGDGTYHEAVNGLQRRMMKEAGLDENDSSINLQQIPLPIGVIPAGTGNGMAASCNGTYDVETAVLTIVTGSIRPYSIIGVHSCGELVSYSSLLVGVGLWSDMIYYAENNRHLGKLRYLACLIDTIFIKPLRRTELLIDYMPPREIPVHQSDVDVKTDKTMVETAEAGESGTPWQSLQCDLSGAIVFLGNLEKPQSPTPLDDHVTLLLTKPCGRFAAVSFMKKMFTLDPSLFTCEPISCLSVRDYKLRVVHPSDKETVNGRKERVMNIDGEIFYLKEPEFLVRFHPKTVRLFAKVDSSMYSMFHPEKQRA